VSPASVMVEEWNQHHEIDVTLQQDNVPVWTAFLGGNVINALSAITTILLVPLVIVTLQEQHPKSVTKTQENVSANKDTEDIDATNV